MSATGADKTRAVHVIQGVISAPASWAITNRISPGTSPSRVLRLLYQVVEREGQNCIFKLHRGIPQDPSNNLRPAWTF